jgi:hypothetical protein
MSHETPSTHVRLTTEEEYFHRLDAELLEQMRRQAAADGERLRLAEVSQISDVAILDALSRAGFHHTNASLLPLVPLIDVAWVDGSVSDAEKETIIGIARREGIEKGSPADEQLAAWLQHKPSEEVFHAARLALRALIGALLECQREVRKRLLLQSCTEVASASGGLFGLTSPISPAERDLVAELGWQLD